MIISNVVIILAAMLWMLAGLRICTAGLAFSRSGGLPVGASAIEAMSKGEIIKEK